MRKLLLILFLIPIVSLPQSTSFDFHSPQNIKKFADYLFCEGDYLRAVEEYQSIQNILQNDTINFKIMVSYSNLGLYQISNNLLQNIPRTSKFKWSADYLYLVNKFREDPKGLRVFHDMPLPPEIVQRRQKLINISYFYDAEFNFDKNYILSPFNDEIDRQTVSLLYDLKTDSPYKSPSLAGILSAVIPGSGKMYVGEWGDGITNLLLTGLFAFLAYDNFKADHTTRAWIFTGIGAFFYAGNIYGSIASAQIFNAKIDFDFSNGLKLFLEQENHFLPDYDFCN